MDTKCKNCKWWQDAEGRVYARISKTWGDTGRGIIELRVCRYSPAPRVEVDFTEVHTDENFCCDCYRESTA